MPVPTRWERLPSSKTCWQPIRRSAPAGQRSRCARSIRRACCGADWHRFRQRNWYQQIFDLLFGMREALRFFLQAPTPLAGAEPRGGRWHMPRRRPGRDAAPGVGAASDGPAARVAIEAGVTVNDLLLCDMFVTLRRWNLRSTAKQTAEAGCGFLMPQNLREPDDVATPTANIMSFAFLTRRSDRCEDSRGAAARVCTGDRSDPPRPVVGLFFWEAWRSALAAGVLDKLLASRICFSTVVLSNFGVPSAAIRRPVSANCPRDWSWATWCFAR